MYSKRDFEEEQDIACRGRPMPAGPVPPIPMGAQPQRVTAHDATFFLKDDNGYFLIVPICS